MSHFTRDQADICTYIQAKHAFTLFLGEETIDIHIIQPLGFLLKRRIYTLKFSFFVYVKRDNLTKVQLQVVLWAYQRICLDSCVKRQNKINYVTSSEAKMESRDNDTMNDGIEVNSLVKTTPSQDDQEHISQCFWIIYLHTTFLHSLSHIFRR